MNDSYKQDIENLRALVIAMQANGETLYSGSILRLIGEVERLKCLHEPLVVGNKMVS